MSQLDNYEDVVGLVIMRADGKILLTKSAKWSGKYIIPGGHIKEGENILFIN